MPDRPFITITIDELAVQWLIRALDYHDGALSNAGARKINDHLIDMLQRKLASAAAGTNQGDPTNA